VALDFPSPRHSTHLPRSNTLYTPFIKFTTFQTPQSAEMSQSRVGGNSNSFNNNHYSFNTVNKFGIADEKAEILEWLSPLEPRIRHDDIRAQRVEDVGDWLLRAEEYQNWVDGVPGRDPNNSVLFC